MRKKTWVIHQEWEDLIFMNWPIPEEYLLPFIPNKLELDTYNGTAWISVLPFRISDMRLRGLPNLPMSNHLLELNVRTYVKYRGEPGVYFISVDASNFLAVSMARLIFGLPYVNAQARMDESTNSFQFTSRRTHKGYPSAHFHAQFQVTSHPFTARYGSLPYWLSERYCLWVNRGKHIYKGSVSHKQWQLQEADTEISINQVVDFLPPEWVARKPVTYFSKTMQSYIFPLEKQSFD